jgi:hypothetical protein
MSENFKQIIMVVSAVAGMVAVIKYFEDKKSKVIEAEIKQLDLALKKHDYRQKIGKEPEKSVGFDGTYLY